MKETLRKLEYFWSVYSHHLPKEGQKVLTDIMQAVGNKEYESNIQTL